MPSLNAANSQTRRKAAMTGQPRGRSRRGATIVEFALCWMLFVLLTMVGVMDLGRGLWAYNVLAHSARAGARYAMVRGSKSPSAATAADVETYVRGQALMLDQSNLTVTTTWTPDQDPGSTVLVQLDYHFLPLFGAFLPTVDVGSRSSKVITY